MGSKESPTKILAVVEESTLTPKEACNMHKAFPSGVISCTEYRVEYLADDVLKIIFDQSPEFVFEHRPDWVRANHPELLN